MNHYKGFNIEEMTFKRVFYSFKGILYKKEVEDEFSFILKEDLKGDDLKKAILNNIGEDYKKVEITKIKEEEFKKEYIVYLSEKYGDNRIFENMEDLKVYIDNKIILEEENKRFDEKQKRKIEEEKQQIDLKEINLNSYLNTIKNPMLKGKIKNLLNKKIRYKGLIMAKYEYIEKRKAEVIKTEIIEKPLYIFNRIKFNRMDNEKEQKTYLEKCNIKTPCYMAFISGNLGFELNKTEFNYLNFIRGLK